MDILEKLETYIKEFNSLVEKDNDKYEKLFKEKLKKWGVSKASELSNKDKKKFFDEIEKEWKEK